jgi:hypothetical protein
VSEAVPKALAAKLNDARAEVEAVAKNGLADEGYGFVRAVDVGAEAARVLKKHGILTIPTVESLDIKAGKVGVLVHATLSFRVIDVDTGESITLPWAGSGLDKPGDKALYQAITGGTKYFRAGLLEIPFGIDPEEPAESADAERIRREQDKAGEPALAAVSDV